MTGDGGWLCAGSSVRSTTAALGAFALTDSMPFSALAFVSASLAISEGANVKVVQKLLGHKSAVLTLDRYGHLFPDDLDAVANAFDTAADALRTATALKPLAVARNTRFRQMR